MSARLDFRTAAMLGQLQRRAHGRAPLPVSATGAPLVAANDASKPRPERLTAAPLDHVPTSDVMPRHRCTGLACVLLMSVLSWLFVFSLWLLAKALMTWGAQ